MDYVDGGLREFVKVADISKPAELPAADVAVCMEVAEHIPFECSDALVDNIVSTSAKNIIFTAATPGQKGMSHINLQPPGFWKEKFAKRGYVLNGALSEKFKEDLKGELKYTPWYLANFMVFEKS